MEELEERGRYLEMTGCMWREASAGERLRWEVDSNSARTWIGALALQIEETLWEGGVVCEDGERVLEGKRVRRAQHRGTR